MPAAESYPAPGPTETGKGGCLSLNPERHVNEQVLRAIIHLLAISVTIDGVAEEERDTIRKFLYENVDDDSVEKYLRLFDEYIRASVTHPDDPREIEYICSQINTELEMQQKVIILLRLIELGLADNNFSSSEETFLWQVCEQLHIDKSTYGAIRHFVETRDIYSAPSDYILIIDSHEPTEDFSRNYIQKPRIKSTIGVLRLPEVDMYLVGAAYPAIDVYLNGHRLKAHYVSPLTSGSVIRASGETIYYSDIIGHFLKSEHKQRITFEARDINYFFPNGKQALHNVQIAEEAGTLVAIMGSSGSGKSTLLNVLNGNLRPQTGHVTVNGMDIYTEREKVRGVIGYIPQANFLIEELTVYENFYYTAKLCFANLSDFGVDRLVVQTLRNLGLYEVKDLKVGTPLEKTISGGQRKRVNIGLELLRQPSVMFVDEPTSGLSSRDSENILDLLRELTMMGKLIFVVIHQPSSDLFKMFDKLLVLDTGGYPVYYGNPVEAVIYFKTLVNQVDRDMSACIECGNINAEQIFNIVESQVVDEYGRTTGERRVSPQRWYSFFQSHIKPPRLEPAREKPVHTLDIPSRFSQFLLFSSRDFLSKLSNRPYMVINLVQAPLLAFILAYIVRFYHVDELTGRSEYIFAENVNIPAFIFMSIIVSLFMGLTISAEEIIKDAKTLRREAFLNLSRTSYLFSKMLILFGFSAFQSFLYVLIGNWIVGIQGLNFTYWVALFTCSCFANMLGLNISATFKSVITIYILIPVLLIPQLILGGVVIKFDEMNPMMSRQGEVPLLGDLMASRWAFEALLVSQFKDNAFEKRFYPLDQQIAIADYKRTYYLPTLSSKLEYCSNLEDDEKARQSDRKYADNLVLLRNELSKETKLNPAVGNLSIKDLDAGLFNRATAQRVKKYLDKARVHYIAQYNHAFQLKDSLTRRLVSTEAGKKQYLGSKAQFHNDAVERLATNSTAEHRIIEYRNRLLQKIYPVYQEAALLGNVFEYRTHFYSPSKPFLGTRVPTLVFNLVVVWLMSAFLYATLYYEVFKNTVSGKFLRWK